MADEDYYKLTKFAEVLMEAFADTENKSMVIPQSHFRQHDLSYDDVKWALDNFTGDNTIRVLSQPSTAKDKSDYEFELSPSYTEFFNKEVLYPRNLYLLNILYAKIIEVLDTILGGYVMVEDLQLNQFYIQLVEQIEGVLEKDGFIALQGEMPALYGSLLGNYEVLDLEWEFAQPIMMKYLGELQKAWIKLRRPTGFELSEQTQIFLEQVDNALERYKVSSDKAHVDQGFDSRFGQKDDIQKHTTQPPANLALEPSNYDPASGVLIIGGDKVRIIRQSKKLGVLNETSEGRLMRLLFHNVNTLHDGVPMRRVVSVRSQDFTAEHRKLVKSYMTEINKKVQDGAGVNDLLIASQLAVMVNSPYLK